MTLFYPRDFWAKGAARELGWGKASTGSSSTRAIQFARLDFSPCVAAFNSADPCAEKEVLFAGSGMACSPPTTFHRYAPPIVYWLTSRLGRLSQRGQRAIACNLPVVSVDVGMSENVWKDPGHLIVPRDPQRIARAISEIFEAWQNVKRGAS